jgi:hypothetical protein
LRIDRDRNFADVDDGHDAFSAGTIGTVAALNTSEIAKLLPYISVRMNTGFYLVFSTGLLIIWLMMFFIFDRLTYWRIRPGQMTVEHLIGGAAESFDTNALRFQKLSSDLFRAALGLGSGELQVVGAGPDPMHMSNVLLVDRKVRAIERLISVKPDIAE